MNNLKNFKNDLIPKELLGLMVDSIEFIKNSRAKNTQIAYQKDFNHFSNWCNVNGFHSLPSNVQTIALYMTDLSKTKRISTIKRRLASISIKHKESNFTNPTDNIQLRKLWTGIKRTNGCRLNQKKPLLVNNIKAIINLLPNNLKGIRDKAIILIGFAGAFRRSELVSLTFNDIEFSDAGVVINIQHSKTDQNSIGISRAICFTSNPKTCPVIALKNWIEKSGINSGLLFRAVTKSGIIKEKLTGHGLAKIIKFYIERIGLESELYSGHSLRSGFATQAAMNDVPEFSIKKQGNWNSEVYKSYIRIGNLFKNNASEKLGL